MKSIDAATVKHVALLSRLSLDEKELSLYARQLESIVQYISKLNEIDTGDVPPTSHVLKGLKNVYRPDEPRSSLDPKAVLANAPQAEGDFFRVPQVIEGK